MNEKIRELAEQAGIKHRLDSPSEIWAYDNDLEKFAELIIRTSILRMEHEDRDYGEWMGNVLMLHFNLTIAELDLPLHDDEEE